MKKTRQNTTRHMAVRSAVGMLLVFSMLFSQMLLAPFRRAAAKTAESGPAKTAASAETKDVAPSPDTAAAQAQAQTAYGKLSLTFEANQGQTDPRVDFMTRAGGATIFLTKAEAVFVLQESEPPAVAGGSSRSSHPPGTAGGPDPTPAPRRHALWMKLEGANPGAEVSGLEKQEGIVNYFIGNDPAQWHADIATYARVQYSGVYPGIDMVYYGTGERQLEYDFVVKPGADARQVALKFEGADALRVEANGDLLIQTPVGEVRQQKPVVYQELAGARQEVESGYVLKGAGRVGFALGAYDAQRALIIDPVVAYSTYLGGSVSEGGAGIAVDSTGNAYVTGQSESTDFPTTPGAFDTTYNFNIDAFVTKLNASGSAPVYSTYLGGSSVDGGVGIAVDSAGNAYVTGGTASTNFPTPPGAFDTTRNSANGDTFVTKLNASGSALVYSTYLGGDSLESPFDIAVDTAGNAYVTGLTSSTNFPTTPGAFDTTDNPVSDAFVTKLNASGSALVYSTYLGGDGTDEGRGIAVDTAGNAYLTGYTISTNFPTTPDAFQPARGGAPSDAFVTKLNASGSALVYSTHLGGSVSEVGNGIAVDTAGNAYVTGFADSTNFPTTPGAFQPAKNGFLTEAFVTKLNASGSALVYSTFLGGSDYDLGQGVAVDTAGNAYVTGYTGSTDFPTTPDALQPANAGGDFDVFVTKLNAPGSALLYSTYLGGDGHDRPFRIAVDTAGNAYVTGFTFSTDFPTTPDAFQPAKGGSVNAFITKFGDYAISGRVIDSGGNGIASVTVTLSGSRSDSTTTDSGGNFVFLNTTLGGNFTVTPFESGFTFSPASITINNLNSNQELLFIGTPPTPTPSPTPPPTPTVSAQVNAANYTVNENVGALTVFVLLSAPATNSGSVDFATDLSPNSAACGTVNGLASGRCDYKTTLGTLDFAAGEQAKFFQIFITDDAYVEGSESFLVTLSNPTGSLTLGSSNVATVTINDNDTTPSSVNPIDNTNFFVQQHYVDFLNRQPDASGFSFWTNEISSCGADAQCSDRKRTSVSGAFYLSIEFQQTGYLVERLYKTAYGDATGTSTVGGPHNLPVPIVRYYEFLRDTAEIGRDVVVGQAGWEQALENNKQAFTSEFVLRSRFTTAFPANLTAAQFVDSLNQNAGNPLSAAERNQLVNDLSTNNKTRAQVLRAIGEHPNLAAAEFNRAFVLMQYFGYLQRNPDDPQDSDYSGYDFWLRKLDQFGGNFVEAEMVKAFLTSIEYRRRFGPGS